MKSFLMPLVLILSSCINTEYTQSQILTDKIYSDFESKGYWNSLNTTEEQEVKDILSEEIYNHCLTQ